MFRIGLLQADHGFTALLLLNGAATGSLASRALVNPMEQLRRPSL